MAAWKNPENFALWLTIVLSLVILLVTAIILFTRMYFERLLKEQKKLQQTILDHQQQLLEDSILIQERERTRIAADLHDDLISKLNISLLSLHTTQDINDISNMLQDSIVLARRISHDLSPPMLEQSSLKELIEGFVYPLRALIKLQLSFSITTEEQIPSNIKLQVFRIFQEVINNTLKHAQATSLSIHLHIGRQLLAIQTIDNGIGFEPSVLKKGLGLKNIRLRNQILQGQFRFSVPNHSGSAFLFFLNNFKHTQHDKQG